MALLDGVPAFDPQAAECLARELFGFEATASLLPGERDQNFLLRDRSGTARVLKVANASEAAESVAVQAALADRVRVVAPGLCARTLPGLDGPASPRSTDRAGCAMRCGSSSSSTG